jgi:hypothetical protein
VHPLDAEAGGAPSISEKKYYAFLCASKLVAPPNAIINRSKHWVLLEQFLSLICHQMSIIDKGLGSRIRTGFMGSLDDSQDLQ